MTLPNHLIGGIVFTGVFAATISGINLLASPWYIATTLIAATLPDIDNTNSPIGRMAGPLGYWINRRYGHRTITHSAFALLVLTLLFAFCERAIHGELENTWFFFWGYLSHIVLDMLTVQGVKLFYPFKKSSAVIPGDYRFRFETGNLRHETLFFCVSMLCFVFLQPLFKHGFWTSYNRLFGTIKHINSEFHKSNDLLEVTYEYRIGTEHRHGKGYCLEVSQQRLLLLDGGKFHHIDEADVQVQKVLPVHTGKAFAFKDLSFVSITPDSLNRLLLEKNIMDIEIHSNVQFELNDGITPEITHHFKGTYLNEAHVRPVDEDTRSGKSNGRGQDSVTYQHSPRIATINRRISLLLHDYTVRSQRYREARQKIRDLKEQGGRVGESNITRYESIRREIQEWEKVKEGEDPTGEIEILRAEIREIQGEDAQHYHEKFRTWDIDRRSQQPENPIYTGFLRYVVIAQ